MTFKLDGKKFLITYSQCSTPKDQVLSHLQTLCEIKYYTVCRESHEDGSPHVHAAVHFSKKIHTTSPRYFDIGSYHPNIKSLKLAIDFQKASDYCKKHGDFLSNVEEKISKRTALAKRLLDHGKLDREFIVENPEIIFTNFGSIQSYLSLLGPKKLKVEYPQCKKRHYWLYGPSNTGKTSLLREFIQEKYSVEIPDNNDWHCDEHTEVLYADEYKGHLTVQNLNKLCDGYTKLNKKGGSVFIRFPIVVICSNYSIRDCYKNISEEIYDTLCNRFMQYELPNEKPDW